MQSRFEDMKTWMMAEAQSLREAIGGEIEFTEKTSYADIVTKYDMKVEASLRSGILAKYPADSVIGEESKRMAEEASGEYVWYIDPIDGTTNFVYQKNNFAISVACFRNGQCEFGLVADVAGGTLYHARRGRGAYQNEKRIHVNSKPKDFHDVILTTPAVQDLFINEHKDKHFFIRLAKAVCAVRSLGCISLELCRLAEGKAGIFLAMRSCPWDHNAAALIVREAGGYVDPLRGETLSGNYSGPVAAFANPALRELFYQGAARS